MRRFTAGADAVDGRPAVALVRTRRGRRRRPGWVYKEGVGEEAVGDYELGYGDE